MGHGSTDWDGSWDGLWTSKFGRFIFLCMGIREEKIVKHKFVFFHPQICWWFRSSGWSPPKWSKFGVKRRCFSFSLPVASNSGSSRSFVRSFFVRSFFVLVIRPDRNHLKKSCTVPLRDETTPTLAPINHGSVENYLLNERKLIFGDTPIFYFDDYGRKGISV